MRRTLILWIASSMGWAGCQSDSDSSFDQPVTGLGSGGETAAPADVDGGSTPASGGAGSLGGDAGGTGATCCETPGGPGCRSDAIDECVCQIWQQEACCTDNWDAFCQITAEEKCLAPPSCEAAATDAGAAPKGACCEPHAGPGCADPEVESCVCELLPDCCTGEWDFLCAQIVREKRCEPGVRECVCDEWEQRDCCELQWTQFCSITAEAKCAAEPACDP